MKKVICILLMWWFPLSMVTAQAMSTKMMLQVQQESESILTSQDMKSCHDKTHQPKSSPSKSHKCSVCGSCFLASATFIFSDMTSDIIYLKTTLKHLAFEPAFISTNPESFIKPPILN